MSSLSTDDRNAEIGLRLAAVRATAGLAQAAFAERLGVSPRAYQNYERGEREVPAALIKALYEIYAIDPIWLLTGPGLKPQDLRAEAHADLLVQIIVEVDARLAKMKRRLPPEKKARLISVLYQHFRAKAAIDSQYLEQALSLTA